MNLDRLPDDSDDPGRPADTTRLTQSPQPDNAPRPEAESVHPPTPDHQPRPAREPAQEREPEREHSAEAPPPAAQSDPPEPAEPRSRQEHAAPTDEAPSGQGRQQAELQADGDDNPAEPRNGLIEAIPPRTQQERAKHIVDVFERLDKADAEGSSPNEVHTVDPKGEIWSSDRTILHHSLLDEIYSRSAEVPCDHEAIVAGGLSGAGKTTVLANHPDIDRARYLTINPDNIKEELARRGMIPEVEGLSPMEASELVHEESSYLARQLAIRAQADGKNLIWDITMSDQGKTEQRINDLREAGYTKIDALFVQIPIETSLRRTEERYWADQDKWLAGEGLGGRLIPPEVILRQSDEEWGSRNRKTLEAIKEIVNYWEIQDNSRDGQSATLVDRRSAIPAIERQKENGL